MIYKLIILTASLAFLWEFMKVRSTAVAQVEPKLSQYVASNTHLIYDQGDMQNIQTIANNQESFKRLIEIGYKSPAPFPIFDNNGVMNQYYARLIQMNDDPFFQWRKTVNNAWLKLDGV